MFRSVPTHWKFALLFAAALFLQSLLHSHVVWEPMPHFCYTDEPISDWMIFIDGFMRNRSLATNQLCLMARQADHKFRDRGVKVDYQPWDACWEAYAEQIYRWSGYGRDGDDGPEKPPNIMVVSYSWGGGWGLRQLATHLAYRTLKIQLAIATDAVRHIGWGFCHHIGLSQLCAYYPGWTIEKPRTIEEFHWFRQSRERNVLSDFFNGSTVLYGHPWVERYSDGWRECENGVGIPDANHTNMDKATPFREKVLESANRLFLQRAA